MDYIDRIIEVRKAMGKKQTDMAELLETTQQQYSKYENRIHELPVRHLITICRSFDVSSDYILGLKD